MAGGAREPQGSPVLRPVCQPRIVRRPFASGTAVTQLPEDRIMLNPTQKNGLLPAGCVSLRPAPGTPGGFTNGATLRDLASRAHTACRRSATSGATRAAIQRVRTAVRIGGAA